MHKFSILTALVLAALIGCKGDTPETGDQANQEQATATQQQEQPRQQAQAEQPENQQVQTEQPQEQRVEEETQDARVAQAGEGARGQGYGGGIVSEPIKQRFLIEERIIYLNIRRAMDTFHALNQRNPNSHEEFMTEVIEANGINLPQLRAGEEYQYDPEAIDDENGRNGVLMIVSGSTD